MKRDVNILVIGYGNTLRRDDGVGPMVAKAVAALRWPGIRCLAVTQLTPELAEPVSQARLVVFVDAAVDEPREVRFRRLAPASANPPMVHATDPRTVLRLASELFGQSPEAWWLTIPAFDLGFGEGLSGDTRASFEIALKSIRSLVLQW